MDAVSAFVRIDDEEGTPWYIRVDSIFAIRDDPDQTVVYFSAGGGTAMIIKTDQQVFSIFEDMRDAIENDKEV